MRPRLPAGEVWAVIPIFDEAPTIAGVVRGLRRHCPVIVVDDASTDGGGERARAAGATRVVCHRHRCGKGAALRTGFALALDQGARSVVTADGDAQHDPADVDRLLRAARAAPRALVLGNRLDDPAGDPMPALRRLAGWVADRGVTCVTRASVRDSQCGFRVYPASLLREVLPADGGFVLETALLVHAARAGYRVVSVPVRRLYPRGRRSRFRPVGDVARIGWFLARRALEPAWRDPVRPGTVAPAASRPETGEA